MYNRRCVLAISCLNRKSFLKWSDGVSETSKYLLPLVLPFSLFRASAFELYLAISLSLFNLTRLSHCEFWSELPMSNIVRLHSTSTRYGQTKTSGRFPVWPRICYDVKLWLANTQMSQNMASQTLTSAPTSYKRSEAPRSYWVYAECTVHLTMGDQRQHPPQEIHYASRSQKELTHHRIAASDKLCCKGRNICGVTHIVAAWHF
jgi:hypothetical protein